VFLDADSAKPSVTGTSANKQIAAKSRVSVFHESLTLIFLAQIRPDIPQTLAAVATLTLASRQSADTAANKLARATREAGYRKHSATR
jgi:hypothetical protein